jgi:hypothetical protein
MLDKPGGGLGEHHPGRGGHRLHPLGQTDLLTDRGVTTGAGIDVTGNDPTGVEPDPQPQLDTVAARHLGGQAAHLAVDIECGQAGTNGVVFQRDRGTEERHDPVAGELIDGAAIPLHHNRRPIEDRGHDLAQPLRIEHRRQLHRPNHIGEQHRHLLVLGPPLRRGNHRSTAVAETGILAQFGPARRAR